jgi:hypothetical protein
VTFKCLYLVIVGIGLIPFGYVIVDEFLKLMRGAAEFEDPRKKPGVDPLITGSFERLLAFTLVAICVETGDAVTALGIWLGLKLAVNWQIIGAHSDDRNVRVGALTALMAGVLSVAMGAFGGWLVLVGCNLCQP